MNQSERRRQALLKSARGWYDDSHTPPAVHPRYRNLYGELYKEEPQISGFRMRIFIGCLLFLLYTVMDYCDIQVAQVNSQVIADMVEEDGEVQEVLGNLIDPEKI